MERRYYPKFHIAPPFGFLNDPNGTCFFDGVMHVFYQHAPEVSGGLKSWGHVQSLDFVNWQDTGDAIEPTLDAEKTGAYSGSALTSDGKIEVFYTGNVKHKGDFDYVTSGREHNVIYATDFDGKTFRRKEVLLTNKDYPENLTLHVRDPKVWKDDSLYKMLLGARTKEDKASFLLFTSEDKKNWKKSRLFVPKADFGYMAECPDYFDFKGKKVLSFCPQGIKSEDFKFQNKYSSGFFMFDKDFQNMSDEELNSIFQKENFVEWDKGFDFYAPQTVKVQGRTLLIGWIGMPDAPYTNAKSNEEGWQNALTIFRELDFSHDGKIVQNPLIEINSLHTKKIPLKNKKTEVKDAFDGTFFLNGNGKITFDDSLEIQTKDGEVLLEFFDDSGCGRTLRKAKARGEKVRVIFDESILEIFFDSGECVMTTRFFPKNEKIKLTTTAELAEIWQC